MIQIAISILLGIVLGMGLLFIIFSLREKKKVESAKSQAVNIIDKAQKEGNELKNKLLSEAQKEASVLKEQANNDFKQRSKAIAEIEERAEKREIRLDTRSENLDKREELLNQKEDYLETRKDQLEDKHSKINDLVDLQEKKLIEISSLSVEEAKKIILEKVESEMSLELSAFIKEEEQKAKDAVEKNSRILLANAILQYSGDATSDNTVSVVNLPNEEMKGRIIGREGRNIRAIESLTGIDLIIDDTPEAVVVSGFDPIRREVAKKTIESLVSDGRIHPARIEELVEKSRSLVEQEIREAGEEALFELGIVKMHPDLIKLIGKLKYRTSYGQNVLKHSIETAFFAGKLAAELGLDERLARRAGLLHDIGKAVDHELEGTHVEIGSDIAKKYGEKSEVINSIESHHGQSEFKSEYAVLVTAADRLSAARPGARRESVDNYLKRLTSLEEIANNIDGVDKSFAIQAGREVRVMVHPDKVDDLRAYKIAKDIKETIESQLTYPGTIKVTVIRETRAVDVAK